jgi:hypothetical protein
MTQIKIHYICDYGSLPKDALCRILAQGKTSKEDLSQYSKCVWEEKVNQADMNHDVTSILEGIFQLFNSAENPLAMSNKQQFIRDNKIHTSMSVGDIVQIDDVYWVVSGCGFQRMD